MEEQEILNELLAFFKALAEENRLKIIGLLSQKSYSVEELADTLGIGVSTTSHHLSRLAETGLVSVKVDGHYYIYSLEICAIREMAQRLLHEESLPRLSDEVSQDVFERKVMKAFVDTDGRIKSIPAQEKKYLVLLHYLRRAFEPGTQYTEKQVNEILSRFHPDTALLRRDLVDYEIMTRQAGGKSYRLV